MKPIYQIVITCSLVISCSKTPSKNDPNPIDWKERYAALSEKDSLTDKTSYLSVYSRIYSITEHRTINLTVTVSLRNTDPSDTIYIKNAGYYNTEGKLIRRYFDKPVYISPLETLEIVIDEKDNKGGSGANFIFDWAANKTSNEPLFEAVMISTSGQQGISFTTKGKSFKK